jgi:hypothetical protein
MQDALEKSIKMMIANELLVLKNDTATPASEVTGEGNVVNDNEKIHLSDMSDAPFHGFANNSGFDEPNPYANLSEHELNQKLLLINWLSLTKFVLRKSQFESQEYFNESPIPCKQAKRPKMTINQRK